MKTIKKDECSYSVSNAIRTLAMEQMTELEAECRHKYRVRSIREDDYGCEERPEGVWPTVLVELEDENGQLRLLRQKDHYLYEQQIEEGDQVILEQEILKRIE